jgi:hypothetical protein
MTTVPSTDGRRRCIDTLCSTAIPVEIPLSVRVRQCQWNDHEVRNAMSFIASVRRRTLLIKQELSS